MARQQLVTALMSQDRFQREILRVRVAIKRLSVNGQQILSRRRAPAVLRAARLAVNVAVLNAPNKSQLLSDASRPTVADTLFRKGQGRGSGVGMSVL